MADESSPDGRGAADGVAGERVTDEERPGGKGSATAVSRLAANLRASNRRTDRQAEYGWRQWSPVIHRMPVGVLPEDAGSTETPLG
jgi:hypothetical protein